MNYSDDVTVIPAKSEEAELSDESEELYYCRFCDALITTGRERSEIDGGHAHTFVNPGGYIFRIGCFRSAVGCRTVGGPTNEYTWFAGRSWTFAVCTRCGAHLGWGYYRGGAREFFGLILDNLKGPD